MLSTASEPWLLDKITIFNWLAVTPAKMSKTFAIMYIISSSIKPHIYFILQLNVTIISVIHAINTFLPSSEKGVITISSAAADLDIMLKTDIAYTTELQQLL